MAEVPKIAMDNETTDSQENGDGDRQVLAPSEGPREDLINTAIKFLQNPKVMGSPLHQKKAFLSKKGLTQNEINIAVERSGVKETAESSSNVEVGQGRLPPPGYQPGIMAPVPAGYGPLQPPIPPESRWAQVRNFTVSSVMVVGVSYAVYHIYKTYLEPLIRGKSAHEQRLERLEREVAEIRKPVTDSLTEISKVLAAIQLSVNSQNQQPMASQLVGRGITDLKADISSLRSLLLSKNQFPPPPNNTPMLPSWQLAGASSAGPHQNPSLSASVSTNATTSHPTLSEDALSASSADGGKEEEEEVSEKSTPESDMQSSLDQLENGGDQMNPGDNSDIKEDAQSS